MGSVGLQLLQRAQSREPSELPSDCTVNVTFLMHEDKSLQGCRWAFKWIVSGFKKQPAGPSLPGEDGEGFQFHIRWPERKKSSKKCVLHQQGVSLFTPNQIRPCQETSSQFPLMQRTAVLSSPTRNQRGRELGFILCDYQDKKRMKEMFPSN